MDYFVKSRRQKSEYKGKKDKEELPPMQLAHFAYLRNCYINPRKSEGEKKKKLQKLLNSHLLKLDPEKWCLKKTEKLYVQPNPRVGEQERNVSKHIFEDSPVKVTMPKKAWKRWYNRHGIPKTSKEKRRAERRK